MLNNQILEVVTVARRDVTISVPNNGRQRRTNTNHTYDFEEEIMRRYLSHYPSGRSGQPRGAPYSAQASVPLWKGLLRLQPARPDWRDQIHHPYDRPSLSRSCLILCQYPRRYGILKTRITLELCISAYMMMLSPFGVNHLDRKALPSCVWQEKPAAPWDTRIDVDRRLMGIALKVYQNSRWQQTDLPTHHCGPHPC